MKDWNDIKLFATCLEYVLIVIIKSCIMMNSSVEVQRKNSTDVKAFNKKDSTKIN